MSGMFGESSGWQPIFGSSRSGAENLLANQGGVGPTSEIYPPGPPGTNVEDGQVTDHELLETPDILACLGDLPPRHYDTETDTLAAANQAADVAMAISEVLEHAGEPIIEFDPPLPDSFFD